MLGARGPFCCLQTLILIVAMARIPGNAIASFFVGDFVYCDLDEDGMFNNADYPLDGVGVRIVCRDDTGDRVVRESGLDRVHEVNQDDLVGRESLPLRETLAMSVGSMARRVHQLQISTEVEDRDGERPVRRRERRVEGRGFLEELLSDRGTQRPSIEPVGGCRELPQSLERLGRNRLQ